MQTEDIARAIKLTAQLMELHNENPFKVKSLSNAAYKLDKTNITLSGLSLEELEKIDGIGKSIAAKIVEITSTGETKELRVLLDKTPNGVIELLAVKGIGPKKVGQLWNELGVESPGELLYACKENRLIALKGFGEKTQEQVKKAIEFRMASAGKYLYASLEELAIKLVEELKTKLNTPLISLTGEMRRKNEIIHKIELLVASETPLDLTSIEAGTSVPIEIITCQEKDFYSRLFETTATSEHLLALGQSNIPVRSFTSENEIYASLDLQYIEPELREGRNEVALAKDNKIPKLIELSDLKGILHNHSTWSDGMNTLTEMALYCKELGYQYLGMCDHSQSAFYANGLKPDRVMEQQKEIDTLNISLAPFKVFKGIESDILYDGSLDYTEEVLKTFDFVVASVHSILKMDKEKATTRLIRAIENPYTTILGHPTGRLLLSREGYPIDHQKVIDACAANNVVMELNSHPYRLDLDWRWIHYCLEKGVMISLNPDAHEKQGFHDMHFGVCVARKGMLGSDMCFNAKSLEEIETHFQTKKSKI